MSSGTLFHIIWNTLPHHLEQCYMLVKPNQKMLELHVKGLLKKEKKRIRNEYMRKFGIRNDAFLSKIR